MEQYLHYNDLNMARATLVQMGLRTKNDPTASTATMTTGDWQGAMSLKIFFTIYVVRLAQEAEEWSNSRGLTDGELVLVADDVLIQGAPKHILQNILNIETRWKDRHDASWSIAKSSNFAIPNGEKNVVVYIDWEKLEVR